MSKRHLHFTLLIAALIVLVLLIAGALRWSHQTTRATASVTHPASLVAPLAAATQPAEPVNYQPLNIELPQEHFRMDPGVKIPDTTSPLQPLFKRDLQESKPVTVGGDLILVEDPKNPDEPVWNQVKGAKVKVEVKLD